jgi:hypothetical protein
LNSHASCKKSFRKILTDVERDIYVERWEVSNEDLKLGFDWRIAKRRLAGGLSDGVDVVDINYGSLSFVMVPTRGMGIWNLSEK